jgi:hypothetical protein
MIEFREESRGDTLALEASNKLTEDDYASVLIPKLEAILREYGKINVLFYMDEGFEGWESGAAWDDAKFGIKHRDDFTKLAVVGGPRWVEWCLKLSAWIMEGEVKTFDENQLRDALGWINS